MTTKFWKGSLQSVFQLFSYLKFFQLLASETTAENLAEGPARGGHSMVVLFPAPLNLNLSTGFPVSSPYLSSVLLFSSFLFASTWCCFSFVSFTSLDQVCSRYVILLNLVITLKSRTKNQATNQPSKPCLLYSVLSCQPLDIGDSFRKSCRLPLTGHTEGLSVLVSFRGFGWERWDFSLPVWYLVV